MNIDTLYSQSQNTDGADGLKHKHWKLLTQPNCNRCGGLMTNDHCLSLEDASDRIEINVRRCLQCGNVIDPEILQNRFEPACSPKKSPVRRWWPKPQKLDESAK